MTANPNVLLVVLDSVRARNCSLYGHEHETTPFLEEFAEEATVYRQARSPGTWSLPSHTSMFTGYHVVEHGVRLARHRLQPGHTIFEELSDQGYDTGVFSENTWITDMNVGLKDAFDHVEGARNLPYPDAVDPTNFVLSEGQGQYLGFLRHCLDSGHPVRSMANGVVTKLAWDHPRLLPDRFSASTPAEVYTDLFLDWADDRDRWAACINYMDAHLPYEPADEHDRFGGDRLRSLQAGMTDQVWEFNGGERPWWQRRALEGLYDGTIHQMDAELRRLLGRLEDRDELEDTLVVVTSDHGEGFGEPSRVRPDARVTAHGAGIHECLLHVPLVVQFPGQSDRADVAAGASLTQFPEVVRAVLRGDADRDAFVPDGPVLASSHGLEEPMEERALKFVDDLWRFNGDALALYESVDSASDDSRSGDRSDDRGADADADDGPGLRKYLSWRSDHGARVRAVRATETYTEARGAGHETANDAFDDLDDLAVRADADQEVDESTKRRLEDLGYM